MLKAEAVAKEPEKEPRNAKMIGFFPTKSLRAELEHIAEQEERSMSQLCYILVMKGLDAYEKDRDLRSPRHLPFKKGRKGPGKGKDNGEDR